MAASVDETIARSLSADPVLLPVLDYLLQDVDPPGSDPGEIVAALRPLAGRRVRSALDLGCGKGAVATALAAELGLYVTGIDAYEPFIAEARRRAYSLGADTRCLFEVADARDLGGRLPAVDVVLLLAGGAIWGDLPDALAALRHFVRPGGYVVIDRPEGATAGGDLEALVSAVAAAGDRIALSKPGLLSKAAESAATVARLVERRARELMRLYPGLSASMWEYVGVQRAAAEGANPPMLWLIETHG